MNKLINTNVVPQHLPNINIPGDDMDINRKPDHEVVNGKVKSRIFIERIPAKEFWSRVNPAIARCLADKAIKQESS